MNATISLPISDNQTLDQRQQVKRRASQVIDTMPPEKRLEVLTDLQQQLIDLTPDDQIDELSAWLERLAKR